MAAEVLNFNSNRCNSEVGSGLAVLWHVGISIPTGAIQSPKGGRITIHTDEFQFQQVQFRGFASPIFPLPMPDFNSNRCNSELTARANCGSRVAISIPTGAIQSFIPKWDVLPHDFNSNRCNSESSDGAHVVFPALISIPTGAIQSLWRARKIVSRASISIPTGAIQSALMTYPGAPIQRFQFQQVQFRGGLRWRCRPFRRNFNSNRCNSEWHEHYPTPEEAKISIPTGAIQSNERIRDGQVRAPFQFQQVQFRGLPSLVAAASPRHFNSNRCNSENTLRKRSAHAASLFQFQQVQFRASRTGHGAVPRSRFQFQQVQFRAAGIDVKVADLPEFQFQQVQFRAIILYLSSNTGNRFQFQQVQFRAVLADPMMDTRAISIPTGAIQSRRCT